MNQDIMYQGVRLDIQAGDIRIPDEVITTLHESIDKLKRRRDDIESLTVYMKRENAQPESPKQVAMRLGVKGNDPYAEENGLYWEPVIRSLTNKLNRQLEKMAE